MSDNKGGGSGRTGRQEVVRQTASSNPKIWAEALDLGADGDGDATARYATSDFGAWQGSWTETERQSIERYQEVEGYQAINGALRSQRPMSAQDKTATAAIDAALNRSRFQRDTILYRGLNTNKLDSIQPGDILHDKGFVSTSTYRPVAEGFAEGVLAFQEGGQNAVLVRILAKKGQKGGFIDPYVDGGANAEVLLPRGSRFRIVSRNQQPKRGHRPAMIILEAELL